jgi:peptide-methionine (S)-S-oxide reductase
MTATLAGGCFWCLEAVYLEMRGVSKVTSGYTGGQERNPTYEAVCAGVTGHAEAVRIEYDEAQVSYRELLEVFFSIHDPTTLNRQGNDVGTQYRSAIYYHDEAQREEALGYIAEIQKDWREPIVTEVVAAGEFYAAEAYHQEYFARNGRQPYCLFVVGPKVEKFRAKFAALKK